MRLIQRLLLAFLLLAYTGPVSACTLWAVAGDAALGGGTIIAKNRDWKPDHTQELRLVSPAKGYRYYGLFAVGNDAPGLKAGLNEHGLVVVSATAGSIPAAERRKMEYTHEVSVRLLAGCADVDEAIAKARHFKGPEFLMLADRSKIAYVEIGPEGKVAVRESVNGVLYHTNHYLTDELSWPEQKPGASSRIRAERVSELLAGGKAFGLEDFIRISEDRNAGPSNSIWRVGSTADGARTVASWMVLQLPGKAPELRVKLANPGQEITVISLSGAEIFRK